MMTFKEQMIEHIKTKKNFFLCISDRKMERELISFLSESNQGQRQMIIYDKIENLNLNNVIGTFSKEDNRLIIATTQDRNYKIPNNFYNFITIKNTK